MTPAPHSNAFRSLFLDALAALFGSRSRGRLDHRTLSAHLQRDLGFLDGRVSPGSIC